MAHLFMGLFFSTSHMSAIKHYLHELREMIDACEQQDKHILETLMETNQDEWSGVETNYKPETNENLTKNRSCECF